MLKRNLSGMAMSLVEMLIGILLLVNPIGFTSGIIVKQYIWRTWHE